jgi:hypothetical protein
MFTPDGEPAGPVARGPPAPPSADACGERLPGPRAGGGDRGGLGGAAGGQDQALQRGFDYSKFDYLVGRGGGEWACVWGERETERASERERDSERERARAREREREKDVKVSQGRVCCVEGSEHKPVHCADEEIALTHTRRVCVFFKYFLQYLKKKTGEPCR